MAQSKLLQEKILRDGEIKPGNILKVDSFLNHQIDAVFLYKLGEAYKEHFEGKKIDKILTIESSGIGMACLVALHFDVPVVYAKKSAGSNMDASLYCTDVMSYTHNKLNHVVVSKKFLSEGENVLILDDFLANGSAVRGLIDLIEQAGAKTVGVGICIEKGYQGGGDALRADGYDVESLAIIEEMDAEKGTVRFR